MNKLIFVTGNKGKMHDAQAILQIPLEIADIEIDEIQDLEIEKIVIKKAQAAFEIIKKPLIVDDAGLYVAAWNGFPGPFVKYIHVAGNKTNDLLLQMLRNESNRKAFFRVCIGYHDGKTIHTFSDNLHGTIPTEIRGNKGWGFDSVFIPDGQPLTLGEMEPDQKNAISNRKMALEKFRSFLQKNPLP